MPQKLALQRKNIFVTSPLVVEGASRAGKFFLGNLLAGIEGVEGIQWIGMVEQLVHLYHLGLIERETLKNIILIQFDNLGYQRMIGRNLNFRYDDKTSVYNSPNPKLFLERCLGPDGEVVADFVKKNNLCFSFLIHEAFQDIDLFLEASSHLKVIHVERHPVDLVFSWFKRGWGRRLGTDTRDCTVILEGKKRSLPWFAYGAEEKYAYVNEMDCVINALFLLDQMAEGCRARLSTEQKNRIHFVSYEALLVQPDHEIEKIALFLGRNVNTFWSTIKLKGNIPTTHPREVRKEKENEIIQLASPHAVSLLRAMEKTYHERWEN